MDAYIPVFRSMTSRVGRLVVAGLAVLGCLFCATAQAAIAFVQVNYATPQTPQSTVAAAFSAAQTAANLNVVVVGWNDSTAHVLSVSDSRGNGYQLAVGPTIIAGAASQAVYYATGIAAGANTVTVVFDTPAQYVDLRVAEYSGVATANALDVAVAATGDSGTGDSGAVTTTNANDLLVGANLVLTGTAGPGSGYTQRVITEPDHDILEDRVVTSAGSYSATAPLTAGAPWIMQLVAFRAASTGGGDITPPGLPGAVSATATSASQINLSWGAAADNVAVTGYLVERCAGTSCSTFAQIGSSATTSYSDTSLAASTAYSYRVRATDAAGNLGGYSPTGTATTLAASSGLVAAYSFDEGSGTTVTDASGTGNAGALANTTWTTSGKNGGALVFNGTSSKVTIPDAPSLRLTSAMTLEAWVYPTSVASQWRDVIYKGNDNYYLMVSTTTSSRPAGGGTFSSSAVFGTSALPVNTWSHLAVTYDRTTLRLYVNGTQVATRAATAAIATSANPLQIGGDAFYSQWFNGRIDDVRVYNTALSAGQITTDMNTPVTSGTPPPDTTAPSAPGTLTATATSSSQINLSWGAATDNVGVTNYLIESCAGAGCSNFAQIATSATTSYSNTGLAASTAYSYRVRATDAANNLGAYSNTGSATTAAPPDTTAPSAPGGLGATAISSTQINLNWGAATDNVGVTNYLIERCAGAGCSNFAQIATSTTTSYSNTGLAASTAYSYRVRATDAANNLGPYSNTSSATTSAAADTTPPSAPGTLTATATSSTQISLSWGAATDNVGVTAYLVESCAGAACSNFAQIASVTGTTYGDSGLAASTSYRYRVRARDAASNLGPYSNTGTATTSAAPDTTPPSAPSTLVATPASATQINLSWGAATDNVGVTAYLVESCAGAGCSNFAQIASVTTTSYGNSGLVASTSYSYRVRATDAASNLGGYSNTATTVTSTPDTTPPSAPASITATAVSGTQINLSWAAATDNVAVTNYLLERCTGAGCTSFAQIVAPTTTSYSDTSLTASTSYSYRVRATDAAANLSGYSPTGTATTQAASSGLVAAYSFDEGTGTTVTDASGTGNAGALANTTWTTSGKNGSALVFNGTSSKVTIPDAPSLRLSSAMTLEAWVYPTSVASQWRDIIYKGNDNYYLMVSTTTNAQPAGGGSFSPEAFGPSALPTNTWSHLAVTYDRTTIRLYVNGTQVATRAATAAIATSANPLQIGGDTFYSQWFDGRIDDVRVYNVALTATQIGTDMNTPVGSGTPPPDTTAPSAPGTLTATATSSSQINLSWGAATDNVGVTNYLIERCTGAGCSNFAQIATSTTTSYSNTGLTASTAYSYRVRATDAANNLGSYSNTGSATTSSSVDTTPPSAPGTLTATVASASQISLSWGTATDNVGVTAYLVESCAGAGCSNFAQIASVATPSYTDMGLAASTSYSYRVRATDAASNLGGYSNTATAVTPTPDTTPPSAPASITVTAVSGTQINVSWAAATDNVAVTNYLVERCTGAGCTSFAQIVAPTTTSYSDTSLTASTAYVYRVRATDAAGNLGAYSPTGTATTLVASTGLVAAYAFDEGSGTGVTDASGTGNAGTTNGTTWTTSGKNGGALVFNGTSSKVTINDAPSLRLSSAMTLEAWVYPTSQASQWRDVIYKGNDNYYLMVSTTTGAQPAGGGSFSPEVFGPSALPTNAWSHLAVTYDQTTLRFYVNGTQVATRASTSPIATSTNPLQIGGDTFYGQYFNGRIDDVRVYNTALTAAQIVTDMSTPVGGTAPPPDTTPPAVSISAPGGGTTQSGTMTVTATATDDTAVQGVTFQVDGVDVGVPDSSAPYSASVNTALYANGSHALTARAWDPVGHMTVSTAVNVTFSNASSGNAAVSGLWMGTMSWPLVGIHIHLLPNGKVMMSDGQSYAGSVANVWDPITYGFVDASLGDNIFCAGHTVLPDGRVIVVGGHVDAHYGIPDTNIFDPQTNTWFSAPNMAYPRWYPTATPLSDGRVLVQSGESNCNHCEVAAAEIYNPVTNTWSTLAAAQYFPYYPHVYQLPDGRILVPSTTRAPIQSMVLDLNSQSWSNIGGATVDGGSSVMYVPGKVLKAGTSVDPDTSVRASSASAYVLDATQSSPTWRSVASMSAPRTYVTLTMLPTGDVLATGGGRTTDAVGLTGSNPVLQAETWNPQTETWTTLASMHSPRLYHSTALLLPDGRVLITGGGRFYGAPDPTDQLSAEIFAPPYLFKGPRPTITNAPAHVSLNEVFVVDTPDAARIASVVMIRPGSVTHSINMNQGFLPVSFTAGSGSITVTAPGNANSAPPGDYMLFIVDDQGVPSVAKFIRM